VVCRASRGLLIGVRSGQVRCAEAHAIELNLLGHHNAIALCNLVIAQ
jgi:hypothetical protein